MKPRTTSYAESVVEFCDRLARDDSGRNLSEYAVLLAAVGIAGVLTFWTLRQQIDATFARVPR